MLTSLCWVPKGAMKAMPIRSTDTAEQVRAKLQLQNPAAADAAAGASDRHDDDDERDTTTAAAQDGAASTRRRAARRGSRAGDKRDDSDSDDSDDGNVDATLRDIAGGGADAVLEQIESDDDEELDDVRFKDTDLVFAVTVADTTAPRMELYTYDEPEDSVFLHHDAQLAAFPLCSAWWSDGAMSMLAVGTMLPFIELWTLDVVDAVEPAAVLGGCVRRTHNYATKRCSKMRAHLKPSSHTDAVLAVRWNAVAQHILASGSADHTIKLWDLTVAGNNDTGSNNNNNNNNDTATTSSTSSGEACLFTYTCADKVQSLDWHSEEANLLLAGGFDGNVTLRDCRTPQQPALHYAAGDVVERVAFVPGAVQLMASTSNGQWMAYEMRMNVTQPLWCLQPHSAETTFACSRHVRGLYATGGKDGHVTLWDGRDLHTSNNNNNSNSNSGNALAPRCVVSRDYKTGAVLSLDFHPNSPHILGACGARGEPLVYTMTADLQPVFAA